MKKIESRFMYLMKRASPSLSILFHPFSKMLSFLFGKSKTAQVAPQAVPQQKVANTDNTMATLQMLNSKESDLEKRNAMLEKNVERLLSEAVSANQAGQKQKALLALKKKNMYEDQIKTNNAMLMRILEQKGALESTLINSDALRAMSAATATMKAEQAQWSADKVRDMTEEIHDLHATHREIAEMIREPFGDGPSDEELLDELDAMSAPTVVAAAPAPVAIPELPQVPSTPIVVPATAAAEDDEIQRQLASLVPS